MIFANAVPEKAMEGLYESCLPPAYIMTEGNGLGRAEAC